ncbi:hypothetical protein MOSE0_E00144 [Monosporozyma servazzii]
MSHNEDRTITPTLSEETTKKDQSPSPYCVPEAASDNKSHLQKDNDETIIDQPSAPPSIKENRKKLEDLNRKIDFMESIINIMIAFIYNISFTSILFLWVPDNIFGWPFYSFWLISHSLFFLAISIIHYQLLPPLIDERYIISDEIEEQTANQPAFRHSKKDLYWCYLRILLSFITNVVIWKCVSYMHLRDVAKTLDENIEVFLIYFGLDILMIIESIYVFSYLGPLYDEPKIKLVKDSTDKGLDFQSNDLLSTNDELQTEKMEATSNPKNQMLEQDGSYYKSLQEENALLMELLKEKENENKRLRKENEERNFKNEWLPIETENSIGE